VFELVNKPTTHTWVEERVVLRHFRNCTHLIGAILSNLRLRSLRYKIAAAEKVADGIIKRLPPSQGRVHCTYVFSLY
jgi:hypothetical protein